MPLVRESQHCPHPALLHNEGKVGAFIEELAAVCAVHDSALYE